MVHPLLLDNTCTWFITCISNPSLIWQSTRDLWFPHSTHQLLNSKSHLRLFKLRHRFLAFTRAGLMGSGGYDGPICKHHLPNYLGWGYSWFPTKDNKSGRIKNPFAELVPVSFVANLLLMDGCMQLWYVYLWCIGFTNGQTLVDLVSTARSVSSTLRR